MAARQVVDLTHSALAAAGVEKREKAFASRWDGSWKRQVLQSSSGDSG
jgi:hypothetical protein